MPQINAFEITPQLGDARAGKFEKNRCIDFWSAPRSVSL